MYPATLSVRPYQLLCAICSLGDPDVPAQAGAAEFLRAVREQPDRPLAIRCNCGDVYHYQDPGPAADTPEGVDFNRKRDLDILQRMNWPPGIILPARAAFLSVHRTITTSAGLCGYGAPTADAWRGCPRAAAGFYEKGREKGVAAVIPRRTEEEMAREKAASLKAMREAAEITLRPHLLLCAVCQYAGGTRPPFKPDNLPEFLEMLLTERPDVPVRLVRQADWMMCAPCPNRSPGLNACVNILGSGGMSNEKRDLDLLQRIGLTFGSVMKARDLYRLIFARITTSHGLCSREGSPCPSVWWDRNCGEADPELRHKLYEQGRALLMERLG
jgi:hypothetical protein